MSGCPLFHNSWKWLARYENEKLKENRLSEEDTLPSHSIAD